MDLKRKVFDSGLLITLAASLFFPAASHAQTRRPLSPVDILRVANVGDAQLSPNGDWIVYTLSTVEGEQTVSTLWLVSSGERLPANQPTSRQTEPRRNWESRNQSRPLLPPGWSASALAGHRTAKALPFSPRAKDKGASGWPDPIVASHDL